MERFERLRIDGGGLCLSRYDFVKLLGNLLRGWGAGRSGRRGWEDRSEVNFIVEYIM